MRSAKVMRAAIARALPRLTAREWSVIAEIAMRGAGLDAEDIETLHTSLQDLRRLRAPRSSRTKFRPGDPVVMYDDEGEGGVMIVEEYRPVLVPKEVDVLWATTAGHQIVRTMPADMIKLAPEATKYGRSRRSSG